LVQVPHANDTGSEPMAATHQPERSWSNRAASWNICDMSVTPEVSQ
jgi:hypothetical protein